MTQTLDWGPENDLSKVTEADNTETTFLNDAGGNRLIRRDTTGTTLYLGETELRLDKTTGKVEATRYYSHAGQTVAMRTPKALTWMSADHNGTGNLQIDAATQAVTRRHTQPFGEQRGQNPAAWAGEKGFVGGTQDPTGLTHLGARDYDTATGRFISVDPVADFKDPQQINGYAYSSNNPVTFADPDGKFWLSLVKIVRAVVRAVTAVVHAVNRSRARPPVNRRIGISPIGTSGWLGPPLGIKPWNAPVDLGYAAEPGDPQAQGGFLDFLGGIGHNIAAGAEAVTSVTPYCWIEDCSGGTKQYDDFVTRQGLNSDTKAWDSGDTAAEIAGLFSSVGAIRSLVKKLLKGGSEKASKRGTREAAKKCAKCFLAGTGVLMADGATKDIDEIKVGEKVQATDPETGESGPRKVTRLIITEDDKHFNALSIVTEGGTEKLIATHEHPFWSPSESRWVEAADLRPAMTLLTDDGSTVILTANRPFTKHARTYNLTVDDIHTYYVLAGQTPVLVHNSGGHTPDDGMVTVGRWMSSAEHEAMVNTGMVQRGGGGFSYVVYPANKDAYISARPGSVYAEFDVPKSSLIPGGRPGDYKLSDSDTIFARLAQRKGNPVPRLPEAKNIKLGGWGCR